MNEQHLFIEDKSNGGSDTTITESIKREMRADVLSAMKSDLIELGRWDSITEKLLTKLESYLDEGSIEQLPPVGVLKLFEIIAKAKNDKLSNYVNFFKQQMSINTNVNAGAGSGNNNRTLNAPPGMMPSPHFDKQEVQGLKQLLKNAEKVIEITGIVENQEKENE